LYCAAAAIFEREDERKIEREITLNLASECMKEGGSVQV
jgi:hypothetical protein